MQPRNKLLYFMGLALVLFIFNINASSAAPVSFGGLNINTWDISSIKQNAPYSFVWTASDSNGVLYNNTDTNCSFLLITEGSITPLTSGIALRSSDGIGWHKTLNADNFTSLGQYNYQIDCSLNSNSSVSGNLLSTFQVTPNGQQISTPQALIYIGIIAIFFLGIFGCLLFFYKDDIAFNIIGYGSIYLTSMIFLYFISYIFNTYTYTIPMVGTITDFLFYVMLVCAFPGFIALVAYLLYSMGEALTKKKREF